jgi:alkylation response protein AidB-like acyl-CoA dehydrogenase|tara:strand:- start:1625 stop:2818 length:1194 start_codon:yes stop_codon:yes gene_type:complete
MPDEHLHTQPLTKLSEEEHLLRANVETFAKKEISPLVRKMDESASIPRNLIEQLFSLGLMGIEVPEQYGGANGHFFLSILAVEELARVDPSIAVMVDVQNTLVINAIKRWGSENIQKSFLPILASKAIGAYALSEVGSGSDAFSLTSQATRDGDSYILTGQKAWITNAFEADIFIVFANENRSAGHRGITAFLVERSTPGLSIGKKEDKLGIRASSTCQVILEECRVPTLNILGKPGEGYKVAIETLNEGRIGIAAQMVGLAQGALDNALLYVQEREQFGKTLSEFQAIQFQLAQAATELEAARLMTYNAARLHDSNKAFLTEGSMAKLFTSQVAERVTSLAVQLLGGVGYTKDYPVEKFYRDAKIGQIYEGTSNLQLQTIAKQILKNSSNQPKDET